MPENHGPSGFEAQALSSPLLIRLWFPLSAQLPWLPCHILVKVGQLLFPVPALLSSQKSDTGHGLTSFSPDSHVCLSQITCHLPASDSQGDIGDMNVCHVADPPAFFWDGPSQALQHLPGVSP